jgi:hypothetical protein
LTLFGFLCREKIDMGFLLAELFEEFRLPDAPPSVHDK